MPEEWDKTGTSDDKKMYEIVHTSNDVENTYRFAGNGRVGIVGGKAMYNRSDLIEKKDNARQRIEKPMLFTKKTVTLPDGNKTQKTVDKPVANEDYPAKTQAEAINYT